MGGEFESAIIGRFSFFALALILSLQAVSLWRFYARSAVPLRCAIALSLRSLRDELAHSIVPIPFEVCLICLEVAGKLCLSLADCLSYTIRLR